MLLRLSFGGLMMTALCACSGSGTGERADIGVTPGTRECLKQGSFS